MKKTEHINLATKTPSVANAKILKTQDLYRSIPLIREDIALISQKSMGLASLLTQDSGASTTAKNSFQHIRSGISCNKGDERKDGKLRNQEESFAQLKEAIFLRDLYKVKSLIAGNPDLINQTDSYGNTSLHLASKPSNKDILKLLLSTKIDVNKPNNHGHTALHYASWKGYEDVVELLLLAKKIDVATLNGHGNTALHYAVWYNHLDVVKLLLTKKEVGINKLNTYGDSALKCAVCKGHTDVVKLLLAKDGINVNESDKDGNSTIYYAKQNGYKEVIQLL
jgi:ankyrin repeat protein